MFSHFTVDDYYLSPSPNYANTTWNNPAVDTDLATPLCCSDGKAVPSYVRLLYFFWPSATPSLLLPYLSLCTFFHSPYMQNLIGKTIVSPFSILQPNHKNKLTQFNNLQKG